MTATMAEKRVNLMSSEGAMFEVDEAVAFESQAVKNMVEDTGMDAPIPLPKVSGKILAKVIEYCKYHVENQKTSHDEPATPAHDIKAWDAEFVKVDQATLFDLILVRASSSKLESLDDEAMVLILQLSSLESSINRTFPLSVDSAKYAYCKNEGRRRHAWP